MTTEETIDRLKAWMWVVGLGRYAEQVPGWLLICAREDFDELVQKRKEKRGE